MSIIKLNNRAIRSATAVGTTTQFGSMVLIKKLTASSSATLSFVNGSSDVVLDNTYKEYLFVFKDIHPETDAASLTFNGSSDTGSNYNVTKTTSVSRAYNQQDGGGAALGYRTSDDLAQSTNFQILNFEVDNDADSSAVGLLRLFNPSSTTFHKHFIHTGQSVNSTYTRNDLVGGYFNTTSAIDAVQFKMASGNIDAGTITLYGIS